MRSKLSNMNVSRVGKGDLPPALRLNKCVPETYASEFFCFVSKPRSFMRAL
jgi:hypothetical protein